MAAALILMVARLTIGKKKYVEVEEQMRAIEQRALQLRQELTQAVSEDAAAFQGVMAAFRMPKNTQEEKSLRDDRIQAATLDAAQVPLAVARLCLELLELAQEVIQHGNLNAISDAGSAASLAGAALNGAALNVRINVPGLDDQEVSSELLKEIGGIESRGAALQEQIQAQLFQRGGFSSG
jgi:glutamate formiminotransferase/formiminotetrahydrofolate cyclodeaminase